MACRRRRPGVCGRSLRERRAPRARRRRANRGGHRAFRHGVFAAESRGTSRAAAKQSTTLGRSFFLEAGKRAPGPDGGSGGGVAEGPSEMPWTTSPRFDSVQVGRPLGWRARERRVRCRKEGAFVERSERGRISGGSAARLRDRSGLLKEFGRKGSGEEIADVEGECAWIHGGRLVKDW